MGNATDGLKYKDDFNERVTQAESDVSYDELVEPEEGLMDLHDGTCCIMNPSCRPPAARDPTSGNECLVLGMR